MALVTIESADDIAEEEKRELCARLESGDILYFPKTPIAFHPGDLEFLLDQQQTDSSLHKNIAYKPNIDRLSGLDEKSADRQAIARLQSIMRQYSDDVTQFLRTFLSPYAGRWRLDYASFRPQEEEGRDLPLRRRNDLLHTDAFPTRPTYGARILRFFNNIHPTRTRDWVVSDPFARTVRSFVPGKMAAPRAGNTAGAAFKSFARGMGVGSLIPSLKRSSYDDFMMRFHNFLKEDSQYQQNCPKYEYKFPPGSSWMVYTDTVPHAVLAGQYALEQTFLVSPDAMVAPEFAPLRVLEEITAAKLV